MTFSSTLSPGREASSQAYHQFSPAQLKHHGERILHVMRQAHAAGVKDLSRMEIRERLLVAFPGCGDFFPNTLTSPVARLIAAGHVEQLKDHRPCTVTGSDIAPLRLVPKQGSVL